MEKKLRVGILGGTGMVGQRFITLLENHPWFEVAAVAASGRSAGKTYEEAVNGRWKMQAAMPEAVKKLVVMDINEVEKISSMVDFVFCAVNMQKDEIKEIENKYAKAETPVVSNNSAHRWTPDVPMVVPEINPEHLDVIAAQKERLGTKRGFVVVKPNCSIQSYTPALTALRESTCATSRRYFAEFSTHTPKKSIDAPIPNAIIFFIAILFQCFYFVFSWYILQNVYLEYTFVAMEWFPFV